MPGNHDIDLHFPGVLGAIRAALGNPGDPSFSFVAEGTIRERRIYVEHGNQYSYDNRFEHWSSPIVTDPEGKLRIERPWGTMFMDLVYNDIEELYPFVNKVYPHGALARIVARIVRDDPKVPLRALAQLVAFLASRGKRMIWEHLMGEEEPAAARVTQTDVEAAVDALSSSSRPRRWSARRTLLLWAPMGRNRNERRSSSRSRGYSAGPTRRGSGIARTICSDPGRRTSWCSDTRMIRWTGPRPSGGGPAGS
jgi:hypothetical protein